jgi:hypothetical protein
MMAYVVSEARPFGLAPFDRAVLLVGMTSCGVPDAAFLISGWVREVNFEARVRLRLEVTQPTSNKREVEWRRSISIA